MDTLRIRWNAGEASFEPGRTVRVGRDSEADIQPTNTNVSRRHVEVTYAGSGWVLRDVGSAQGTWRNGKQVESVDIRGTIQVTLGREGRGEVITLEASPGAAPGPKATQLAGHEATPGATELVGERVSHGAAGSGDGTIIVGAADSNRPGGALRADAIAGATVVTGDALNIECAGRSSTFQPGRDISIGRDAQCDIVSSNPTVSRRHARIFHTGKAWTLADEGSSSGTFIDGERIGERELSGSVAVWLGDEQTGERLVIVASGPTQRKKSSKQSANKFGPRHIAIAAGALVVLLVIVGWSVTRGGGDAGPSNDHLGRATVRLIAGDIAGSGTIIDADQGLILTNAHVVAPDAPGAAINRGLFDYQLPTAPRDVDVLVAPGLDQAAEPRFVAEVVAADGYLDLAVLKITQTVGGTLIEPDSGALDELVDVKIGDSTRLTTGDEIRVFGYPSAAQTSSVTLSEGVVSGPVKDERIGSNHGMLNMTADISAGNSGGLAVNDAGQLVGVPSLVRDGEVPSMRPVEFAAGLIEAARSGETYKSPFYRLVTSEKTADLQLVEPNDSYGIRFDCGNAPLTSVAGGAAGISFTYEGFEPGEHQDIAVALWAGDSLLGMWTLDLEYPVSWPSGSGCATITIPVDTSKLNDASLSVDFGVGPGYTTG